MAKASSWRSCSCRSIDVGPTTRRSTPWSARASTAPRSMSIEPGVEHLTDEKMCWWSEGVWAALGLGRHQIGVHGPAGSTGKLMREPVHGVKRCPKDPILVDRDTAMPDGEPPQALEPVRAVVVGPDVSYVANCDQVERDPKHSHSEAPTLVVRLNQQDPVQRLLVKNGQGPIEQRPQSTLILVPRKRCHQPPQVAARDQVLKGADKLRPSGVHTLYVAPRRAGGTV